MTNRIDSRSLTLFLAVAESLSFRQAAETLHMSQPPLSRAIREFEERLGARLFERDTRGVALTAAGKRLLPRARQIMSLLEEATQSVRLDAEPAILRLGLTVAVEAHWFSQVLARLRDDHPNLPVKTVSASSPNLVRQLRAQRIDAAFIATPTEVDGLETTELYRQPMMLAMHSAHRLARRKTVGLADLQDEPMFWFERARQPAFFDHSARIFARHGLVPKVVREPTDHVVLLAGVSSGQALALLPASFRQIKRNGIVYRPLREGDELAVGLALATLPGQQKLHALLTRSAKQVA